jgi:putative transcription antitermination factor YqgF
VVGLPRNSQGQETQQSQYVRQFAKSLNVFNLPIECQDESLTSVEAKSLLNLQRSNFYNKQQIDAMAAALILTDYLEAKYAR